MLFTLSSLSVSALVDLRHGSAAAIEKRSIWAAVIIERLLELLWEINLETKKNTHSQSLGVWDREQSD